MEEPPDPGGECCRRLERKLRKEFETRFMTIEKEISATRAHYQDSLAELHEMVEHRNEMLQVANNEIKARETKIKELNEALETRNRRNDASNENNEAEERKKNNRRKGQKNAGKKKQGRGMESFRMEKFSKFFILKFENEESKRSICPFKFELELTQNIGHISKPIQSTGRESFMIEVDTKEQGESLRALKNACGKNCKVESHEFFKDFKG